MSGKEYTKEEIAFLKKQGDLFKEQLDASFENLMKYIDTLGKDDQIELMKKIIKDLAFNSYKRK